MGRTEIQGPSQVDVILGEQSGTSTLTAANGDTLVITFVGTVQLEGPDPEDPVTFDGTWTVIDGTGRFADATGFLYLYWFRGSRGWHAGPDWHRRQAGAVVAAVRLMSKSQTRCAE